MQAQAIDTQTAPSRAPVLRVEGLTTVLDTEEGTARPVDGIDYDLHAGETLAVVGESGSGKSLMALSLMRLVPSPPARVTDGTVTYQDKNLLALPERDIVAYRGAHLSMIFQDPMTSLNPVLSIGRQLTEIMMEHLGLTAQQARLRAVEMLRRVHIPEPQRRLAQFPHQLSGGMLQRVMIAIALSCNPKVLIADEPTTALDVTIQAQILALLRQLQDEFDTAIILITHDLGVVAEVADRVLVMYAGRKVEEGSVYDIFERPCHPYTRGLLDAQPSLSVLAGTDAAPNARLAEIPGMVPPLTELPAGCHFAPRCALATPRCTEAYPPYEEKAPAQWAACWESQRLREVHR